jgi:adenylate cyclase
VLARRLGELAAERPGILKEAGLSALQVWEAVAVGGGSEPGDERLAIVFTDLVGFSDWALEAGDDLALQLLREVAEAIEPPVAANNGEVVKRLGDGMMAVFANPDDAVAAMVDARERLRAVEVAGYGPRMRAGMHVGAPRRLADDYLGVDVNVAARVAEEASGDEFLVSGDALESLSGDSYSARKKLRFRPKGVPSDVSAYSLRVP